MYTNNSKFIETIKSNSRNFSLTYCDINSVRITTDNIQEFTYSSSIGTSGKLAIGSANSSKITMSVIISEDTPSIWTGEVKPIIALTDNEGTTHDIPLGVFYIDKTSLVVSDMSVTFDAYDILEAYDFIAWDQGNKYSVSAILSTLTSYYGLEVEGTYNVVAIRTDLNDLSVRQVIAEVALLLGTNAIITREGKLKFIKPTSTDFTLNGDNYINFLKNSTEISKISKITVRGTKEVLVDGETETQEYTISDGDDTGSELIIETNNINTPGELRALVNRIGLPIVYQSYQLETQGFPHIDCGDSFQLTTVKDEIVNIVVVEQELSFTGGCKSTFSASPIEDTSNKRASLMQTIASIKAEQGTLKSKVNSTSQTINEALEQMGVLETEIGAANTTANGKNTVYYFDGRNNSEGIPTVFPTAATGTVLKTNDIWFNTGESNCAYRYNGESWVRSPFGSGAFDNLDAGKITAGILSADRIGANTLIGKTITGGIVNGATINSNDSEDSKAFTTISGGQFYSQGKDGDNYKSIRTSGGAIGLERVDNGTGKKFRNVITSDINYMYNGSNNLVYAINTLENRGDISLPMYFNKMFLGNKDIYTVFSQLGDWASLKSKSGGYLKMEEGIILQWGDLLVSTTPNTTSQFLITFPITFPNTCAFVIPTPATSGPANVQVSCSATDSGSADLYFYRNTTTSTGVRWLAIGW